MTSVHSDGTPCKEGTANVPAGFAPCCDMFGSHTSTCDYDVRYEWWSKSRQWVISISESAGGGGIQIFYCPHCGTCLDGTGGISR